MAISGVSTRRAAFFPHSADPQDFNQTITLLTLQGIVNRTGPNLLIDGQGLNDWSEADKLWRKIYTEQYHFEFEDIDTFDALVRKFRRRLKGAVVYDPDFDASRFVAITMGGVRNLLPLTPAQLESLDGALPIVEDLRGRWTSPDEALEWSLSELLPHCDRKFAYSAGHSHDEIQMGWDFGVIGGLDYVVMRQGLVFNFSPAEGPGEFYKKEIPGYPDEARRFRRALELLEAPAAVYGWAEPEWTFTEVVNQCGHYVMCGHESNLSFHRKVSTRVVRLKQSRPPEKMVLEDKCYLAFLTSEGDTPRLITSHFFGAWEDPARGSFPVNWGTNPLFPYEFPVLAEYFQQTATPNDFFFAGVGGCGYIFPDHMKGFEKFLEFAKPHFARSDIFIADIWQRKEAPRDRLQPFAEACNLDAILQLPQEGMGDVDWLPNGTVLLYQHVPLHYFHGAPEDIASRVEKVAGESPGPRFLLLYNSPPRNAPSYYKSIANCLDSSRYVPVRLDVMVDLIGQHRRRLNR